MKFQKYTYIFILGFLCFFISQILLRIPILTNYVYKNINFTIYQIKNPLLTGILIAIGAGVFEEVFRFLFRKYLIKNSFSIVEPILFGLGHSLMEIIYIFKPLIINYGFGVIGPLAIVERIIATIFHIEMSIVIWDGFLKNKKYLFLITAIFLHSLMDSVIPIGMYLKLSVISIEIIFAVLVILIGIFNIKWSVKNYEKK